MVKMIVDLDELSNYLLSFDKELESVLNIIKQKEGASHLDYTLIVNNRNNIEIAPILDDINFLDGGVVKYNLVFSSNNRWGIELIPIPYSNNEGYEYCRYCERMTLSLYKDCPYCGKPKDGIKCPTCKNVSGKYKWRRIFEPDIFTNSGTKLVCPVCEMSYVETIKNSEDKFSDVLKINEFTSYSTDIVCNKCGRHTDVVYSNFDIKNFSIDESDSSDYYEEVYDIEVECSVCGEVNNVKYYKGEFDTNIPANLALAIEDYKSKTGSTVSLVKEDDEPFDKSDIFNDLLNNSLNED